MSPAWKPIFESLLSVETEKMERQLAADIDRSVNWLAGRGNLNSSAGMHHIVKAINDALPIEAQLAMTILLRALTGYGQMVNGANKEQLNSLLVGHIQQREAKLKEISKRSPPMKSPHATDAFYSGYHRTAQLEIQRVLGEMDLIAASNDRLSNETAAAPSSFVFNGPVGLVQTGAGSFGYATQVIDTSTRESILKALSMIEQSLVEMNGEHSEIVELLADTKGEASKEKPNLAKLKALVSGLGSAISYIPKAREGYENLKWAASMMGINLP